MSKIVKVFQQGLSVLVPFFVLTAISGCGTDTAKFCQAFSEFNATSTAIGTQFSGNPDLSTVKSLIARLASEIDQADGNAPSNIKADSDSIRSAVDRMNSSVQGASTVIEAESAISSVSGQSLTGAATRLGQAGQTTCGFKTSPTP
jgi:hypothetical protein